ncbi:MAG TPA: hypothetical protein VKY36_06965 [Moheibacter sp.]|nr:hypothetical protein [Moheibacter sp.]
MNYKITIGIVVAILIIGTVNACASKRIDRQLLSKGTKTYPWKIYYVTETEFPVGTKNYYEVKFDDKPLISSKEIIEGNHQIDKFTAAGFDKNNGTVILVFPNYVKKENGFDETVLTTVIVNKVATGSSEMTFWIQNMNDNTAKQITLP